MRFFSLFALVTALAGVAFADDCKKTEMGCDVKGGGKRDFVELPARDITGMTNAELLRRDLPLKSPVMRRGSPVRRHNPSGVPQPTVTHNGCLQVINTDNNNVLGYVSSSASGGYYFLQSGNANSVPAGCLAVTFTTDQSGSGDHLRITMTNSNELPTYSLLGLNQGRDSTSPDLAPGSFNYLYIGGVATPGTPSGSPPTSVSNDRPASVGGETSETDVWKYDSATGLITAQWINTDGSSPKTLLFTQSNALYAGGDSDAFHSRFPAPVTKMAFKLVSF